jgi:vancomycin resistance protein YoaR
VLFIILSMVIDAAVYNSKVHGGVTIEGQKVSGLTQDAAVAKMDQYLAENQDKTITLTGGGKSWQVKPSDLGTKVDVATGVAAAMNVTRQGNLVVDMATKLKLYFSGRDVKLQGSVDSASLDTFIGQIATALDQPAVNASLTIRGSTVAVLQEKEGLLVDQPTLKETLTEMLLSLRSTDITIPMVKDSPDIVSSDNTTAMAQARTMVNAAVTLTSGEKSWTFTPEEIASYVVFTSAGAGGSSGPKPSLSAEKMMAKLQTIGTQTTASPADATFKIVNGKVKIVPGVEGVVLDVTKTAEALTAAALKTTDRTAEVQGTKQEPEVTTAEAEAMGITDLLGEYTTRYAGVENRSFNVALTVKYLLKDGKLYLKPGQEFSFKETVGPRTAERGFRKAPGIVPGIQLEDVYGGGICQVSTTLFNAVLLSGLKVTERRNHTLYIDHYPRGRDATVTDDGPDFKFVNDTDHYIWITGKSNGRTTTLQVWGTSDGRKVSLDVSKWYAVWGPYTSTTLDATLRSGVTLIVDKGQTAKMCMLTRTITWPDGKKAKNQFESNYKHRYMIVKVGTGTTTTTVYKPPTSSSTVTTVPYP